MLSRSQPNPTPLEPYSTNFGAEQSHNPILFGNGIQTSHHCNAHKENPILTTICDPASLELGAIYIITNPHPPMTPTTMNAVRAPAPI